MAAPTVLTPFAMLSPFDAIAAGALTFDFAAGTAVDGDVYPVTGREILIAYNSDIGAQTITIESEDDEHGRQEDVTNYSIAAGKWAVFSGGLTNERGWKNSSNQIRVTVGNVAVKLAILKLPARYP